MPGPDGKKGFGGTCLPKDVNSFVIQLQNNDIKTLGMLHFRFEILILGRTKGQVNYLEENIHHRFHVSSSHEFYNDCIGPRRFANVKLEEGIYDIIKNIVV